MKITNNLIIQITVYGSENLELHNKKLDRLNTCGNAGLEGGRAEWREGRCENWREDWEEGRIGKKGGLGRRADWRKGGWEGRRIEGREDGRQGGRKDGREVWSFF